MYHVIFYRHCNIIIVTAIAQLAYNIIFPCLIRTGWQTIWSEWGFSLIREPFYKHHNVQCHSIIIIVMVIFILADNWILLEYHCTQLVVHRFSVLAAEYDVHIFRPSMQLYIIVTAVVTCSPFKLFVLFRYFLVSSYISFMSFLSLSSARLTCGHEVLKVLNYIFRLSRDTVICKDNIFRRYTSLNIFKLKKKKRNDDFLFWKSLKTKYLLISITF